MCAIARHFDGLPGALFHRARRVWPMQRIGLLTVTPAAGPSQCLGHAADTILHSAGLHAFAHGCGKSSA
eukprot:scaffold254437_cov39-Tisochrysis_lutea.AAC.3